VYAVARFSYIVDCRATVQFFFIKDGSFPLFLLDDKKKKKTVQEITKEQSCNYLPGLSKVQINSPDSVNMHELIHKVG
jgi:hypothetical protein